MTDAASAAHITTGSTAPALSELASAWRTRAADLRRWAAAEGAACAYERAAEELLELLTPRDDELLNLAKAAPGVGAHRDTIGTAIRAGRLTNHGAKHRPLVRRGELTRAFPASSIASDGKPPYDPVADARSILGIRRGGH